MTKREKKLGALVGALVVLLLLGFGYQRLSRLIDDRRDRLDALDQEIRDKKKTLMFSRAAADRLAVYEERSLPSNLEQARSKYQTWLLDQVKNAGFEDAVVNATVSRDVRGVYHEFAFTVSGQGDLKQLIHFLHEFYSANFLHRIRRLNATRISETRRMNLALSIDAVALPTADPNKVLDDSLAIVLAHGGVEKYLEYILSRNLSGPKNQEPSITPIGSKTAEVNRPVSFTVRASDPDKLDSVTLSLKEPIQPGANLDPKSGAFTWTPTKTGEYTFSITATDDGWPAKSDSTSLKITVREPAPPPPKVTPPPRKPNFDLAKFAFVTAITEADGRRQTWINLRSQGKLFKLFEGDEFPVGEVDVVVLHIDDRYVELEAVQLDRRFVVALGKSLADPEDL